MTNSRLEEVLKTYLAKPGFHGTVFVRFIVHDGAATVEHWAIELPHAKQHIGRRENREVRRD